MLGWGYWIAPVNREDIPLERIRIMRTVSTIPLLIILLVLSACGPASTALPVQTSTSAAAPPVLAAPRFTTSIGDFEIAAVRLMDEVNGTTAQPGAKILILILTQPGGERLDPATFSLEAFDQAIHDLSTGETHISGDDGSDTISSMAGWLEDGQGDFAIGFQVPESATQFTFIWPGNEAIKLTIVD